MADDLRPGEQQVQSAGGKCAVCRQPILPGPAVQLSKYTSRIRHVGCMPKSDSRSSGPRFGGGGGKALPE